MTIDAIMPGVRVLCAVSGGVDSMYLLHRMTLRLVSMSSFSWEK